MSTRPRPRPRGELLRESGLADPGLAEDREEVGAPFAQRALERLAELGELAVAADQRRVEATQERRSARDELEQLPGRGLAIARARAARPVTASRTSRRVASPIRISPGALASWRGAASTAPP